MWRSSSLIILFYRWENNTYKRLSKDTQLINLKIYDYNPHLLTPACLLFLPQL